MSHVQADPNTISPIHAMARGVARFQDEVYPREQALYRKLVHDGQKPKALMISCADSRVIPEMITQCGPGELFVCRNAGNIVPPFGPTTGGVSSVIEYAVLALGVRDIVVCGHSDCGAMSALLHPDKLEAMPNVAAWLHHSQAAQRIVEQTLRCDAPVEARQAALAKENVVVQINHLRTHPAVATGLATGKLTLHGWLFELEHGTVLAYDGETGRFTLLDDDTPPVAVAPVMRPRSCRWPRSSIMNNWFARDVSASFVVFLVAMPLCMGIAIASGVPPERSLLTGIIGGIVVGMLSGSPLQVSGPAAGLVVMVFSIVHDYGIAVLGPILVLAGALQCLAGVLRLGGWFRAISPAVVHGMLAGIGVLIVAGQLRVLFDYKPMARGMDNLLAAPGAFYALVPLDGSSDEFALLVGVVTMGVMLGWERFRPAALRLVRCWAWCRARQWHPLGRCRSCISGCRTGCGRPSYFQTARRSAGCRVPASC